MYEMYFGDFIVVGGCECQLDVKRKITILILDEKTNQGIRTFGTPRIKTIVRIRCDGIQRLYDNGR